jgi:hypothetical protein
MRGMPAMEENLARVIGLLEEVVSSNQLGRERARQLESAILESVPDADDDPTCERLMHMLASYEPAGGPFLYNDAALVEECRCVLSRLKK